MQSSKDTFKIKYNSTDVDNSNLHASIKSNTSMCLNMIVKNESHIIVETLKNLCSYFNFSYWVICDTGSTDNTKEVITDFFKERNIKGELHEHKWEDFAHNRTLALECAYNKTDYLLIFDADDSIKGNFVLPKNFNFDGYTLKFGTDCTYLRPLIINNRKKWKFVGVLHEYLASEESVSQYGNIDGDYHVVSGRAGARNKNPNKYYDDAIVLKNAHYKIKDSDYNLSCRYAFYCAQSYKDANYIDEAIEWYEKCLGLNMWLQEKYVSSVMLGHLYVKKNDKEKGLKYYFKSIEYDSERIDGIIHAMSHLLRDGQHTLINALYHKFKKYSKNLKGKLFMDDWCYRDELEYYNCISAYYINDKESGYECCKKIFLNKIANLYILKTSINNFQFYIDYFHKETDEIKVKLFYLFNNVIHHISMNNEIINPTMYTIWNNLFENCRPLLTKPSMYKLPKVKNADSIIITFTTCKRIDLFKETIYSILNHWNDVDKINYWFCVDDNSSSEDRKQMKKLFNWIDFYMKTDKEKGHIISMNIIWDKLNELKPKYWIHMEDDFLFYKKMNYVEMSINAINSKMCIENNVKQILFNRNYGETIESYNAKGHLDFGYKNNDIVLHNHCEGIFPYQNCHYWPHYSFRPSLVDVSTILELGNFDSDHQFFERSYADKWNKNGYKSAFFNNITSKHTGRLTSERHDKSIKNAYALNDEDQFFKRENKFIKIINLERRTDRKENTIKELDKVNISKQDYEFIKAVDGLSIKPTIQLKELFKGNDFGNRKGVIGCALSHYNLWKQLLNDTVHDYYIIMEDDYTLPSSFKRHFEKLKSDNEFSKRDVLFLGYHMFEAKRNVNLNIYNSESDMINIKELNNDLYIGGFFAYSINKEGAKKMIDYISKNGIKHGIDYLFKIYDEIKCYECQPQIVFSVWNENGKKIDSNIQHDHDSIDFNSVEDFDQIKDNFIFIPDLDVIDNDLYYKNVSLNEKFIIASEDEQCVGFNTLGFFKNAVTELKSSQYFKKGDGIYIKKNAYDAFLQEQQPTKNDDIAITITMNETVTSDEKININHEIIELSDTNVVKIKMLCNWTSSQGLCNEWSNMCDFGFRWKNYQLVWTDKKEDIDYYVIINKPPHGAYYDPKKTIVFQMEPYVNDTTKNWGVKTWGEWANPDPNKFLSVRGRKTNYHNNAFWQLELSLNDLLSQSELFIKPIDKNMTISSICSSKYFDEGHIARIDFLKFLEEKNDILIDIYNYDNNHQFKNYRGPLAPYKDKSKGIAPHKYYFMVENNYETNFITEKLWEPILCETLCFYYGCPNVDEYIDSRAFVLLDMNDFEKSYQIIKKAIEEDWWSDRINIIRKEKQKILNQLAFFPTIERTITFDKTFGYFNTTTSNYKNVCFIHSWTNNNHQTKMLDYIIDYIKESKLFDVLDVIYVMNIGNEIDSSKYEDKIKVINYSNNNELFELQTIKLIHTFSEMNPNCNILYLHTKGVSFNTIRQNIMDWMNVMLYFNVKLFDKNLKLLETYDALGCNYRDAPLKHFSGNFWWAKASYIKKLNIYNISNRHDAEWFILSNGDSNYYCLYDSKVDHYMNEYPASNYENIM